MIEIGLYKLQVRSIKTKSGSLMSIKGLSNICNAHQMLVQFFHKQKYHHKRQYEQRYDQLFANLARRTGFNKFVQVYLSAGFIQEYFLQQCVRVDV